MLNMTLFPRHNRPVTIFFAAAVLLHLSLLLVPVTRELAREWTQTEPIKLRLTAAPRERAVPEPVFEEAMPVPERLSAREIALEAIPEPPVTREPAQTDPQDNTPTQLPPMLQQRIISSQFLLEQDARQTYLDAIDALEQRPDYFSRDQASLYDVLNEPVLQLPFKDTRIYEVAYYEAGFNGAVDKFWDTVSVPFGFTTKNNMRVQCVWVLILAGCAWDHKTVFHREAKRRKATDTRL